jgi:hypothetical protein
MSIETTFDKAKYRKLKQLYNKAVAQERESFLFEEQEILVSYAKYLIEYLKPKFKIN